MIRMSLKWRNSCMSVFVNRGLLAVALASALPLLATGAEAAPDLSGAWRIVGDHSTIKTIDGKLPPFHKEAADRYAKAVKARKAGKPIGDTVQACMPHGLPRLMFADFPFMILQESKQLTFIHEVQHMPREVYIDAAMPALEDLDQNFMGFSSGHWDGDALVVQSQGFNDRTTIDRAGIPHSTDMKLTERLRVLDGGKTLEDVITVDDPKTFTKPWSTRVTFEKQLGLHIKEYVCTDNNLEAQGK
jgi:hypothetical protein